MTEKYLSPGAVAKIWHVRHDKVISWIRSGELRALNMAQNRKGKLPRYKVPESALGEFERKRQVVPPPPPVEKPARRAKAKAEPDYVEYL